jgi:hypothetical protein
MTYEQANSRLLNHGNLVAPDSSNVTDEEGFVSTLWKAEKVKSAPVLNHLYEGILSCLEVVNRHVNGDTPSETAAHEKQQLNRSLVNAMWYVIHKGWDHHLRWEQSRMFDQQARDNLALTVWRISSAWGGVLDGDIDSLAEHVRYEEIASW